MAGNEHDSHEHAHEELHEQPAPPQAAGSTVARPEEAGNKALADALKVSFLFLKWAMVLLVIIFLLTGIFTVQPGEVKFKLRFGDLVKDATGQMVLRPGGWHLRWPWEEVVTIPTDEKTLTLDKEFWAVAEAGPDIKIANSLDVRNDGYLVTGDANIVHMKLSLRYRAGGNDADSTVAYAFLVEKPEETLRRMFMASVVKVVGSMPVMEVIKPEKTILTDHVSQELQRRLDDFQKQSGVPLGISVTAVALTQDSPKNPTEPGAVRKAFNDAQDANSKASAMVSEGKSQATNILTTAEAQSKETVTYATGYATRMVRSAMADAAQMGQLMPKFEHSQGEADMLMEDFYERAVAEVLAESPGAFVFHEPPEGIHQELRMQFSKPPTQKPGGNQPPSGQAGPK